MLIALCSVKGSPGVTTLAMGLAARWPHPEATCRLVAEVDPSGGDLALRFGLPTAPGLVSLAAVVRRVQDPAAVWEHTQPLPAGPRVLVAPPGGPHARAALHTMVTAHTGPVLHVLARVPGVVVLADCGRVDRGSPAEAIARRADALILMCRTRVEDLAHAAARLPELAGWTARPGLLLTGQGYATAEVERELGVSAIGRIPDDPVGAAAFSGRRTSRVRRRGSGGFEQSVTALARVLAATAAPRSPAVAAVGVPGVPAQQVRLPGGEVVQLREPPLDRLRPVPTPPAWPTTLENNGHHLRLVGTDPA
ncbi:MULTISPECIES: carbon monoxide dehydrogenase maturation protein [unclassified Amycolatopsis]|uniref:carbon monoxide dehydrogenase maturation protein n=1 Tax=unclassified Amycolatopsis TaxID=2618356 RepID=UPI001C69BD75|nr:carbon monoxide dehydrogenase maturation protein [Amycolatopsis sp. DSM 110486]QYN20165.1 carbon monoxide dehydrogenase maturation protein [Amycolatopsis sp. DSM 110486]